MISNLEIDVVIGNFIRLLYLQLLLYHTPLIIGSNEFTFGISESNSNFIRL